MKTSKYQAHFDRPTRRVFLRILCGKISALICLSIVFCVLLSGCSATLLDSFRKPPNSRLEQETQEVSEPNKLVDVETMEETSSETVEPVSDTHDDVPDNGASMDDTSSNPPENTRTVDIETIVALLQGYYGKNNKTDSDDSNFSRILKWTLVLAWLLFDIWFKVSTNAAQKKNTTNQTALMTKIKKLAEQELELSDDMKRELADLRIP